MWRIRSLWQRLCSVPSLFSIWTNCCCMLLSFSSGSHNQGGSPSQQFSSGSYYNVVLLHGNHHNIHLLLLLLFIQEVLLHGNHSNLNHVQICSSHKALSVSLQVLSCHKLWLLTFHPLLLLVPLGTHSLELHTM